MRSAVLFDLDCTLTDRPASIRQFAARFGEAHRNELTSADPLHINDVILGADDLGYAPRSVVCDALSKKLEWRSFPQVAQLVEYWRAVFPECSVPREGARETISSLRANGWRLGIVSNGNTRTQRRKLEVLGITDLLDAVVISDEVGCRKPDCRIFELAIQQLNIATTDAWFVGDHPRNDVEGARTIGLKAIWFKGVHPWPQDLSPPEYSIDRLEQLPSLLTHS